MMKRCKIFLLAMMILALLPIAACNTGSNTSIFKQVTAINTDVSGVQFAYKDYVYISWLTTRYTFGQVEWGPDENYGTITPWTVATNMIDRVKLTPLEPDTTYYYRVIVRELNEQETVSEGKTFTTHAE